MRAARPALLLSALVVAVYAQVRGLGFVNVDDDAYVYENARVLRGLGVGSLTWAFGGFHVSNWHPLTWLSHMLDVTLLGPDPGGMHVVNAGLHLGSTLLLLAFLRAATGSTWRSAAVAGLFAVHPLHVESVAWISERKDVLSTFLGLAALLAWLGWARRRSRWWYGAALACFALSLLAKPMLITLPFVLLLLDVWPLGRLPLGGARGLAAALRPLVLEKLPFLALSAASAAVTLVAQSSGGGESAVARLPLLHRLANAVTSAATYLGRAVWPAGLSSFYPHPSAAGGVAAAPLAGAALLLLGATWLALRERVRRPWLLVGWLLYLGTLVPVIGLVQVGSQGTADRYTYVPLLGPFLAVAWCAGELALRGRAARVAAAMGLAVAVLACAAAAHRQVRTWRDAETLHRHALAVDDRNWKAWQGLCSALLDRGRPADAAAACRRSLDLLPTFHDAWNSLGVALARQGETREALRCFQRALELRPGFFLALRNVGSALGNLGDHAAAARSFARAVEVRPEASDVWAMLVLARTRSGDGAGAREALARLRELDPARAEAAARRMGAEEASP